MMRFLGFMGKAKVKDLAQDFTKAVVSFDPKAATEAQIEMMVDRLEQLGRRVAEAETEVKREHKETEALESQYARHMKAAEIIQARMQNEPDKAQALEKSLTALVVKLEELAPEIEREKSEDAEAEAFASEIRQSYDDLAAKVKTARTDLVDAQRRMERAKLREQHNREREQRAKEAAGLTNSVDSLNIALSAMNKKAEEADLEADAASKRVVLFGGIAEKEDPAIAAALAEAAGETKTGSVMDRLAALKK